MSVRRTMFAELRIGSIRAVPPTTAGRKFPAARFTHVQVAPLGSPSRFASHYYQDWSLN